VKVVIQRVTRAQVRVGGRSVAEIGPGMLLLVCVERGDDAAAAARLAERAGGLRFFPDAEDRMNVAAPEAGAAALVVSQFTLAADGRKGRRPSFDRAAPPEVAEPLVARFAARLAELGLPVATGVFGARMEVELVNDGPVTFFLEERPAAGAG